MKYCPTGNMIADFFTKALQVAAFQKFRDQIMNVDPAVPGLLDPMSVLENMDADVHTTDSVWIRYTSEKEKGHVSVMIPPR